MTSKIDLHIHTTFSDGLSTPQQVLDIARKKGLKAFSFCDHDNIGALNEIKDVLVEGDPELVPGVELSAGRGGEDIHMLGYFFNPQSNKLQDAIHGFQENRNRRGAQMLKELRKLKIDIPMELVLEFAGDSAIGRPHVADALVRVGAVRFYNEAFTRYIGMDGPAYVAKQNCSPSEVIELIHEAGGLAYLAHPGIADVARYIPEFVDYGLDGIEVYHSSHNSSTRKALIRIAEKENLLKSGGSDFHGRNSHHEMIGSQNVPEEYLLLMKEKLGLN